jgi:hypothetical protein
VTAVAPVGGGDPKALISCWAAAPPPVTMLEALLTEVGAVAVAGAGPNENIWPKYVC